MKNISMLLSFGSVLFAGHLLAQGPSFTVQNNTNCQYDIQAEAHTNGSCTPNGNVGTAFACTAQGQCTIAFPTSCAAPTTCETLRFRIKETGTLAWSNWAGNDATCTPPLPNNVTFNTTCGTVTLTWTSSTTGVVN